jgi:hypothetical protein
MSPTSSTNPYNEILAEKHSALSQAFRFAQGATAEPGQAPVSTPLLKILQIQASSPGDNIIIPAIAGTKQVFELVMFNVAAQDLLWAQGLTTSTRIPLLSLPGFPALTTLILPFNGSFDMSHWDIDTNQPLSLNLSTGTPVTGFIRYRVLNGSS